MTTKLEYAALAAVVYNDQRGGGGGGLTNVLVLPPGWKSLSELGFVAGDNLNNYNPFSATAGAYLNQSTGEIVIAYKGTDFLTKFEGRSFNTVADMVANVGLATAASQINVPAQLYAASYYAAVKDWAADSGYDSNKISFTGHSLGGGLASNMAVWFGKPATTFAEGPFELSTSNRAAMVTAIATLSAQAAVSGSAAVLDAVNSLRELLLSLPAVFNGDQGSVFARREAGVAHYYNQGEVLEYLRGSLTAVYGSTEAIDIGARPFDFGQAVGLHSMNLHAAFLYDDRLRVLAKTMPELIPALLDNKLYAFPPTGRKKDLITNLVNDQLRQGFAADSALKRFTGELMKLQGDSGMAAQPAIRTALIAAGMDYFYNTEPSTATRTIFSNDGNGIHLNLSDLGIEKGKSKALPLLVKAMRPFLGGEDFSEGELYAQDAWHIQSGTSGMIWSGGSNIARDLAIGGAQTDVLDGGGGADLLIGGAGADFLTGGAGTDILVGGVDADVLKGGTGNDKLLGGIGADIYQFTSGDGKDTIADSDGLGSVVLNGNTLAIAEAFGERDKWKDANGVIYQFNRKESDTKGWLTIKAGDTGDEITINDFDLTKARADGYLGIKLKSDPKVAVVADAGTNFWSDINASLTSLEGQASSIAEGTGKTFTVYLNAAAKANDTITLALGDLADKFKAILGDTTVAADGAVITLAEGQTQVSFALVQEGEVTTDGSAGLSVSYQGEDSAAESNTFTLNLQDTGEIGRTYNGDQRAKLIGIEIDEHITPDKPSFGTYKWSATSWANDGTLNGGIEEADFADVIYAGSGNDKINGKGGNDALSGGAGNDEIDGGEGNDMIAGGTGSDDIQGGAGDDYISTSSPLATPQRLKPTDTWSPPAGEEVKVSSATWGVYIGEEAGGGKVTIWAGIGNTDTGNTEGDVVDGGAGKDDIIASWGDDRVQGGDGDDHIDGLAGDDVLEGGDGDDNISADGIVKEGYLNSVAAVNHGADFVDGGEGKDNLNGGGKDDQLFGGAGDDFLAGDSTGKTDGEYYVELQYHGEDYLDGEDGDDYLEGGGKEDTLYGGMGADSLWGDTGADNIVNESDNALMWANDYLDGEDGDDQLVGGGKDDTLYGGIGDDKLFGDEQNIALKAEFQGQDYLDGEDGDDYLEGGGKADILFGGKGKDNLWGDASTDALAGADHGDDYLDGEEDDDSLVGNGGADTLYGGAGKDTLFGDDSGSNLAGEFHGADYLDGEGDDDYLEGGGGSDILIGGAGTDTLVGDMQGTTLAAQYHGDDTLDGGEGDDTLLGGGGNDTLIGGIGADFLSGDDSLSSNEAGEYTGDDTIDGGEGNDTVLGGKGNDTITGGAGDDMLFGGEGDDTISGGDGNDILAGGQGVNTLDGGAGDDGYYFTRGDGFMTITDSGGQNTLWLKPGIGIDDIKFSLGSLKITSGTPGDEIHIEGFDPSDAQGSSAVQRVVFEDTGRVYSMAELLEAIGFDLEGTADSDSMVGTSLTDRIDAGEGNDAISAEAGNDVVDAGAGDDYIDGGAGNDTVLGGEGNDVLVSDAGADLLNGGAGDDFYSIGALAGNTIIVDGSGSDRLSLDWRLQDLDFNVQANAFVNKATGQLLTIVGFDINNGAQTCPIEIFEFRDDEGAVVEMSAEALFDRSFDVIGTPLEDSIEGSFLHERIQALESDDIVNAGAGNDTVSGGDGNDVLDGESGHDFLEGDAGSDVLYGGGGNDTMNGGAGNDRLVGGAGADLLVATSGSDSLDGGADDDTYVVSSAAANTVIVDAAGVDKLRLDWALSDTVANADTLTLTNSITGQVVYLSGLDGSGYQDVSAVEEFEFKVEGEAAVSLSRDQLFYGRPAMLGTTGADNQQGTEGDDLLIGLGGNDTVLAGAGNDVIRPGAGVDRLEGEAGDDTYVLSRTIGNKVVVETSGNDKLVLGWRVTDVRFDAQSGSFFHATTLQRVKIEGFDINQGVDSCPIEGFELIDDQGNTVLLTPQEIFARGIDVVGTPFDDVIEGSILKDRIYALSGDDVVNSGDGNDVIDGAEGNDVLNGETGNDEINAGAGQDILSGGDGDDLLDGNEGDDQLHGGAGDDALFGSAGNDVIDGGAGADTAYGGYGGDIYIVDDAGDIVHDQLAFWAQQQVNGEIVLGVLGDDFDEVNSSVTFTLGQGVDDLILTGDEDIDGTGNWLANYITGNSGDNVLIGSGLNGHGDIYGSGYFFFVQDELGHGVFPQAADEERAYDLGLRRQFLERLSPTFSLGWRDENNEFVSGELFAQAGDALYGEGGDDKLYGDFDNDQLDGGTGNDLLVGGGGSDLMWGGEGDDTYVVSSSPSGTFGGFYLSGSGEATLIEQLDQGVDHVLSAVDWALGENFENLTLLDNTEDYDPYSSLYPGYGYLRNVAPVNATGNALANEITGNMASNVLLGLEGDDLIFGAGGDDHLDGGAGADRMEGGEGNDTYIVDSAGDVLVEESYQGNDTVVTVFDTQLQDHFENLTLASGSTATVGIGNIEDNYILGNENDNDLDGGADGYDVLDGGAGNDRLRIETGEMYGDEGDDTLIAGWGDNTLDGGSGADDMDGGEGSDIYMVDDEGDQAREAVSNYGLDTVISSVSHSLGEGIENLQLTGSNNDEGRGNALNNVLLGDWSNNVLVGMAGDDFLEGREGRDVLIGGEGDETYTVNVSKYGTWGGPGSLEDEVIEQVGEGLDTMVLQSVAQGWSGTWGALIDPGTAEIAVPDHVENLDGSALTAHLLITGNDENNSIVGGSGRDDISGGAGDDAILGDTGITGQTAFVGPEAAAAMEEFLQSLSVEPLPALVDWNALRSQLGILDALPADADPAEYVALQMVAELPDGSTLQSTIFWPRDAWHADYGPWEAGEEQYSGPWSETGNVLMVDAQGLVTVEVAAGTDFSFSDSMANWSQRPSAIWETFKQQYGVQDVYSSEPATGYVRVQSTNFPGVRGRNGVTAADWPTYALPAAVQEVLAPAIGTAQGDVLHGDAGNDVLDGGRGSDALFGGEGDDQLFGGDDAFVTVTSSVLNNGEGIYGTALSIYTAPDNNDFLDGGSGNDYIDGQAGNDEILGGDGDDDLYGGDDNSVQGGSGYGGGGPVGLLAQSQSEYAGYGGYGGAVRYYSNEDLILGGQGNDRIDGGSGNDQLFGGSGSDEIRGGADGWINTSNDDYLDGGEGLDTLIGESGNDTYIVDGTSVENPGGRQPKVNLCDEENRFGVDRAPVRTWTSDAVIENIDSGYDTVHTTASVVLDNVETVVLLESGAILDIDATTGAGSQELTGNSGDNRLDGGLDADYMSGGDGDDTYVVDNTDDEVFEEWDEGFDTVRTDVDSYALGENLEGLVLEGAAIAGYGNDADNVVIGNAVDNHLEGGAGDDILAGWRGNDELLGGAGADTYAFSRGDGVDTVVDTEGAGKLRFSGDIVFSDLAFSREGDDLVVDVMQNGVVTGDRVILAGWTVAPERVNSLEFCVSDPVPLDESVFNRAPVALVDSNEVTEDGQIAATGNVLANDSDPNPGQTLTLSNPGTYQGSYGRLVLGGDGNYAYHLNSSLDEIQALAAGETLSEVFSYRVQDSFTSPLTAESTLNITIFGSNDGPVALVDTAVVQEDQALLATGNVLINDHDVDTSDVLTVTGAGVMAGAYGSLALSADGSYAYTLNNTDPSVQSLRGDEQVTENFAYALTDGLESAPSVLTVTVSGTNDAPVAFADFGAVQEDQVPLAIGNVLFNDSDVDRATVLRVSSTGNFQGQWGVLTLNADGGYSYALNSSNPDVQALAEGQSVSEQFVYVVVDDDGNNPLTASSTLSIVITGSNDGPVALVDGASAQEDVSQNVAGNVLANDRDVDQGDTLSVVGAGVVAGNFGTLALEADGNYVYSLNNGDVAVQSLRGGQQATDSFEYGVTDADASAASSLNITVIGTNDAPVAFADVAEVKEDAGMVATGNVLSNDRDIDQATVLTVSTPGSYQGQWGVLSLNVDGSYSYVLNNQAPEVQALAGGQSLRDEFVYSVVDDDVLNPLNASSTLSITINGSNDAPLPQMDAAIVSEDGVVNMSGNVLANDSDPDSGNLLVVANPGSVVGTYGSLNLNSNGNYTFSLNNASQAVQSLAAGQTATQLFTYSVQDDDIAPLNASSQLSITVTGVNDAPILVTAMADQSGREGQAFNFVVPLATFTDIDQGDVLSFTAQLINADGLAQALPVWLSFNTATRAFSGTPDMSAGGSYSLRVTATDRSGATTSDLFVLNVVDDCGCTDGTVINGRECRDDILNGTSCDDLINGKSGNDKLYGNAGDDILDGGEGCDVLDGGAGNDVLVFGADSYWRGANCTDAVTTNSGSPGVSGTGEQVSIEGHARSFDSFEGGAGIDTLRGSCEDDAILLEDGGDGPRIRNIEIIDGGWGNDVIDLSSVRYAYGDVKLIGGQGNDTLWSSAGNDVLQGNEGCDELDGGVGHDLLQGGSGDDFLDGRKGHGNDINQGQEGSDIITDGAGQNLLDGGSGADTLTDGDAASFFFGGKNSDTIKTGKGADLIAFNRGDGSDTVYLGAESAVNDTLSLGKGIKYSNLKLKKSGNDLILDMGVVNSVADKMTFKNWYASSSNRTIGELQVVTVGGDYDAASTDKTRNKQVEVFDFTKLVQKFDAARALNSANANGWAVMNSLLDAHLQGSNTAALGGDLSFQYATTGSLAGIGLGAAQSSLAAGTDWQNLQARSQLEQGSVKLM